MEVFVFPERGMLFSCFEDFPNPANPCKTFVGNLLVLYFLIILGAKVKGLNEKYFFVPTLQPQVSKEGLAREK